MDEIKWFAIVGLLVLAELVVFQIRDKMFARKDLRR